MDDNVVGLAAVVLSLAFPLAVVWAWAWQRGRKYRADERMAAIARGLNVPFEPDLAPPAASRRAGILLLAGAVGATLNWSWWLEYVVIAPSAVWLIVSGRLVVYRQLGSHSGPPDRRVPVLLVVPVLLAAAIQPTRYAGLVAVVAFAVVYAFSRRAVHAVAPLSRETHSG